MTLALYPLTISPAAIGQPYNNMDAPLTPVGGTAPYTLALTAGALPPGLSFDDTHGFIVGTPHVSDQYDYKPTTAIPYVVNPSTFTITATDSLGATASVQYTMPVGIFNELQAISIYEMLDAAYGFDYYVVMSDMGSREMRIGDIGSPAFGGLRLVTNAMLAQFTQGMIEVMLQHIHEWDMIKRIFMDQQGGGVSDITGLNNKISDRKSGLLRRFKNLLPAYTKAEVEARRGHGGGMDITNAKAGAGGNVEFVR